MQLSKLSLRNYRNFDQLDLELPPGLSVISGRNAVGKSNLLEAIFMLAIAKSYRAVSERELVAWKTAEQGGWTTIEGDLTTEKSNVNLMVGLECLAGSARKHIRVNDIPKRSSGLIGLASMVLFNADDIDIVFPGSGVDIWMSCYVKQTSNMLLHFSVTSRWFHNEIIL